jgi:hypothetical protein
MRGIADDQVEGDSLGLNHLVSTSVVVILIVPHALE